MKYYAVTEDPRELYHYGVKGMKWGQHIFGDKPKSPGYHRALGKLRASASKGAKSVASSIKKSSEQRSINRRAKEMAKYLAMSAPMISRTSQFRTGREGVSKCRRKGSA